MQALWPVLRSTLELLHLSVSLGNPAESCEADVLVCLLYP